MSLTDILSSLESSDLAARIGESWWFPLLESLHVVGVVFVVGSILMVDLRLLGIAARGYPASKMNKELTPWSWGAFALATITGIGLFITRANHYIENPAFRWKLLLLLLAGVNMTLFHFGVWRRVQTWDQTTGTPITARLAAALSLIAWSGVVLAGRWTGHLS